MTIVELIGIISDLSMAGLVAVLFVLVQRSRDTADRLRSEGERREDTIASGLIELIKDLSANIQANTTALASLRLAEEQTLIVAADARRESVLAREANQEALEKAVTQTLAAHTETHTILQAAAGEMRETVERRHAEYLELIARMERQQQQLDELTKKVRVSDLPIEIRGDIARLMLLVSNIGADVKTLLRGKSEPGESVAPAPETTSEESTHDG
jgi:hypothetical protein